MSRSILYDGITCPFRVLGAKGARLYDWCYLELATLDAEEFNEANNDPWTRGLLIRRRLTDGDLAYFTTWCPAGTSIETLAKVEGHRGAIEDSFETAKNEFGLDHYETRSWHGWHRHVPLVMLAFAMMAVIRHAASQQQKVKVTPKKQPPPVPAKTAAIHLLVYPGNQTHRPAPRAKADNPLIGDRAVALEEGTPSRRKIRTSKIKITTVMLVLANTYGRDHSRK